MGAVSGEAEALRAVSHEAEVLGATSAEAEVLEAPPPKPKTQVNIKPSILTKLDI